MLDDLKELIKNSKVISFDIFDTLITRIVDRPEAVFELMEKTENIVDFSKIRQEKQSEIGTILLNKKNYPHATLDEIYDYIKETTSIQNTLHLKRKEIEIEKELLFPNQEIKDIVTYARKENKRIIVTSDMYLDLKTIKDILKKCGYDKFDYIYLSSFEKKAKFNGELFDVVIEKENVNPSEILHIGDNYNHDYVNAKEKGLKVYHYKNTLIKNKSTNLTMAFHNGICRLLKLNNKDFFINLGAKAGLLYLGLFNELMSLDAQKIYFLARDGYNLYHLFNKYSKNKKAIYVYASRRAMLIPSITTIDDETVNYLPPFTFGQTVGEILDYVSLKNIFTKEDLNKVGISDFSDTIKTLTDFTKVHNLYKNKKREVLKVCQKERKAAFTYFNNLDLDKEFNVFFDCGWNGTSQYFLENLLATLNIDTKIKFYYTGILDNAKSRKQLQGKNFNSYLFSINDNLDLAKKLSDNIAILELFFGAPHNSLYYYAKNKDGYVLEDLEKDFDYKNKIYKGLDYYFSKAVPIFEKYHLSILRDDAINPILNLIEHPTEEEAIMIGDIPNVDGFAAKKGVTKYIAKVTLKDLEINENTEIYWKNGLIRRPDISSEVKEFVKKKYNLKENESNNEKNNISYYERLKKSLKMYGYRTTFYLLKEKIKKKLFGCDLYNWWIKENENKIYEIIPLEYNPLISLIIPVYNAKDNELTECLESVLNQTYTNFEICIVDDCSTNRKTLDILKKYQDLDTRIKVGYHKKNEHISKTTNDAIALAKGEFIALLDNDDILAPNALYEMAKKLNEDKNLDFIYSDEDKLTEDGKNRHFPFFKPDFSPDTFNSLMYTCHFSLFRKTLVNEIGGFTVGLDGAQDYDFVMRFTEVTNNIAHISKILYHWRERVGSIANNPKAKPYALDAILKLKEESLKRQNLKGRVVYDEKVYQYRIDYEPKKESLTLILFGKEGNIEKALTNLANSKALKNIYILNNNFININSKKLYQKAVFKNNLLESYKIIKNKIKTEYVMFYNTDNIVKTDDFIDRLTGAATLKNVGVVGAKYLDNNNIIINCGLSPSINKNVLNGKDDNIPEYYCRNVLPYNTYAVSEDLCVINKEKLDKVIDKITDFELSLGRELLKNGYYNVVRNDVVVIKKIEFNSENKFIFSSYDPFINCNLDRSSFLPKTNTTYYGRISKRNKLLKINEITPNIIYEIEASQNNNECYLEGYIFKKDFYKNNSNKISIILKGNNNCYEISTMKIYNQKPTLIYNTNLNFTSFRTRIKLKKIANDNYKIYIHIKNMMANTDEIYNIDKKIEVKGELYE